MSPTETHNFALLCQALSVLDTATGEFLEHRQLRRDPKFKPTWDTSYANELGRLCQGIGVGPKPNSKRVEGTNTFFRIDYDAIPVHKRKEICHTLVVWKYDLKKMTPTAPASRLEAVGSAIQEMWAPTQRPSNW